MPQIQPKSWRCHIPQILVTHLPRRR